MNKLERIKVIREELAILEEEFLEEGEPKEEEEFEYPLYKQGTERINDAILKFTSLKEGTVVYAGNSSLEINDFDNNWRDHTQSIWKDIAFDEERGLYDKQLVWCCGNNDTHTRALRFYDAINKCSFTYEGERRSYLSYNYEPYEGPWPEWAVEAYKTLEG